MGSFATIIIMITACLIIYRLFTILGKKTGGEEQRGHEIQRSSSFERTSHDQNDQTKLGQPQLEEMPADLYSQAEKRSEQLTNNQALASIFDADPDFDLVLFIDGAKSAYEIILTAYAAGDLKTLKPLLTSDTYKAFKASIDGRKKLKHVVETEIIGISTADIVETSVEGTVASITTKIQADVVTFTKDSEGEVVEGDPNIIDRVIDIWTFNKDINSDSPEWFLSATDSEDEQA